MNQNLIQEFTQNQLRKDFPSFRVGDIIRVYQKHQEEGKEKAQPFEGLVIAKKHGKGINATFTVRRNVKGYGVEKIFPLHSPTIEKIKIIKKAGRVRRAKLYWTRAKTEREIHKKLKLEQVAKQKEAPSSKTDSKKDSKTTLKKSSDQKPAKS